MIHKRLIESSNVLFKIFVLGLITGLSGCRPDAMVYYKPIESSVQTLNPKNTRARSDFMIAKTIFGQFLIYNSFGNIQPGVFRSWKVSEDGKTYLFDVDPNATFHDDKSVTADDVLFSIHYLAAKDSLVSRYFANILGYDDFVAGYSSEMIGVKKLSQNQIEVKLKSRSYIFLAQLADPKIVLLPKNLRGQKESEFFEHPIGAGAYKLKLINQDHSHLVLERFNKYFGIQSNIESFDLEVFDKAAAMKYFLNGRLDDMEVFTLTNSEIEDLKSKANLFSVSSYSINLLILNGRERIFRKKKIRNKLAQAIDIAKVANQCERLIVPTTGLVPHGLLGWSNKKDNETGAFELQKSKVEKKKILRILSYGVKPQKCIIDQISEGISEHTEFSVVLDFQTEKDAFKNFLAGDYDLLLEDLSVRGPEPFNIFTFFDPQSPHDLTYFKDSFISRKLKAIEGMIGGQRAFAYSELSRYIAQEQSYVIPLFTDIRVYAFGKRVKSKESPATLQGNTAFEDVQL